mgnify:CR=1 FL=1
MGADGAAGELFGGGGEAVEEIAGDEEEIHQHRIGGERHRTELRALTCEQRESGKQREGADHDVAVERQHAPQGRHVEDPAARQWRG